MTDILPSGMTDAAMLAVIIGFISPVVLNFLIASDWRQWVKSAIAFLYSAVVGTTVALVAGAYTGLSIVSIILVTLFATITFYENFWKNIIPKMQAKVGVGSSRTRRQDPPAE